MHADTLYEPSIHLYRVSGLDFDQLDNVLNPHSGLLGMTGKGDMRDVDAAASAGEETNGSPVAVLVITTNEELEIATQTASVTAS